jgi:two-component system, response regulator PdtaR
VNQSLRIAVADDERDMREYLQTVLPTLGHEVVGVAETGPQLVEQCRSARPDLVVTDIRMPGLDGIQAAAEVNKERPVPFVLVSGFQDAELLERAASENVMAYLIKPVKSGDLVSAIQLAMVRFEQYQAARREAGDLRRTLEERKVIERAKGAVMRRLGVDEAEAYRRMRQQASDRNQKLADVARTVLNAEEVFQTLDKG